jgi:hypothetical protein
MRKTTRELRARIDPGEEMAEKRFRDSEGNLLCDRCHGPIVQPSTGRRRLYCGRTCREMAYRERATQDRINDALKAAGVDPDPVSSVVETAPVPVTSVVETRAPLPRARRRRSGMTASAMPLPVLDED